MTFTSLCQIRDVQIVHLVEYWIDALYYWEYWNKTFSNKVPERVKFCRLQINELTGY